MADNYLITGYWGEPHVTAENDRGFNAAVFGAGRFVLPVGEMFRAEYIGNNTVRVYDGKLLDGGALAGIPAGKYIDFLIPEAGQGMNRNDLIIFEYSQDASTLIESGVFKVVSGTETSGTAADPVLYEEDLLSDEATLDQMALFRVPVSGAVISDPEALFVIAKNMESVKSSTQNLLANSDFSNPVSSGTSGTASYSLAKWTAHNLTITQETNDIKTVPTTTYAYIRQNVKVTPGKTYTCAARFSNAGVGEIRIYDTAISTQYAKAGKVSVVGLVSFTVPDGVREISVLLYPNAANVNSGIVYWAALYEGEYTANTLPEYQPRGYALEAAVCALNFNVVGGATQPTNPAENTIWVNTDTEITGWIFSATQPATATEGMVWISVGASSPAAFNALNTNGVMVYPISAKQYLSGEWVSKTAKSYQNGEWVDWITYLFKEGDGALVGFSIAASTATIGTDGITFSGSKSEGLYTETAIVLEKTTTFCIEATITTVGTSADYIGSLVAKTPSAYTSSRNDHPTTATARTKLTADGVRTVYKMSLSAGTWHLGISGNVVGTVHNMWYE